jgi:hypothetical protein
MRTGKDVRAPQIIQIVHGPTNRLSVQIGGGVIHHFFFFFFFFFQSGA